MAQEDYGAAEPILGPARKLYQTVRKYLGDPSAPASKSSGSSTDSGKLPDAWEEANRKSIQQQLDMSKPVGKVHAKKRAVQKPPDVRKRVPRKATP